jgi:hypothetical protein
MVAVLRDRPLRLEPRPDTPDLSAAALAPRPQAPPWGPIEPALTRPEVKPAVRATPARSAAAVGAWWGRRLLTSVKGALLGATTALMMAGAPLARAAPSGTIGPGPSEPARGAGRGGPRRPKALVFVGMNPGAEGEAKTLARWSATQVIFIGPGRVQDQVLVGGKAVDLATADGRATFARALALPEAAQAQLTALLAGADRWGRDELARLARVFAEAEHGDTTLERLVLSGHSLGPAVWGDDNGELSWRSLATLAQLFPQAARQVEDVAVAACYAGGESQVRQFQAIFPNLQTFWGYHGSAPGAASGSVWHLKRWEAQTRGSTDAHLDRRAVAHLRKGGNVATWTASRGYDNGAEPAALTSLRDSYARTLGVVDRYRTGELEMADPGAGPLRSHYENLQRLLQRGDLPAEERPPLEAEREEVIRLIYYRRVAGYFEAEHRATFDRAFEALGLERPDFAKLSRKDALAAIGQFELRAQHTPGAGPAVQEARALLVRGLRDMRPERIPQAWL